MTSPADVTTAPADAAPVVRPLTIGHGAVLRAIERNTVTVTLPALGNLRLPPAQTLAWFAGLATLTVVGLME